MIFIKIFTLAFDPIKESFDDRLFIDFLKNVELTSSVEHFFTVGSKHYITVILKYELSENKVEARKVVDFKKTLNVEDAGVYELLREWRAKKAKSEGVPPYVIFSNKHLSEIASTKPQSLTDLSKIDGVGESKVKKYGQHVLEITSYANKSD